MVFGDAISLLKVGGKVARPNWRKDEYVILVDDISVHTDANIGDLQNKTCQTDDCLCLKTADNIFRLGWSPSQSDLLAEDWGIVE